MVEIIQAVIRAILFDLDGVLVSFADCHYEALNLALQEVCGLPVAPQERGIFEGLSTRQKLAMMVAMGQIPSGTEDAIYRLKQAHTMRLAEERVESDPVKILMCRRLGMHVSNLACVSNCIRASVEVLLTKAGLRQFMEITVSNEDVVHPKPAPDPYLLACQRLHVDPRETLAVEDHDRGVQSAQDAGCHVVQLEYERVNYLMITRALDGIRKASHRK